jgi:hypothetical protein
MSQHMIFVTGDKGGVGKTFFARTLADFLSEKKQAVVHVDTDKTNATFRRFMGEETILLNLDEEGSLDELVNRTVDLDKGSQVIIDCAARSLDQILTWMDEVSFEEIVRSAQIELTLAFVLGPDLDSLQILKDLHTDAKTFNLPVNFLVIKNFGRGEDYSSYDNSQIRKTLLNEGAKEITLESLLERTVQNIDRDSLRFLQARDSQKVGIMDRQRVSSYVRKAFEGIEGAAIW